LLMLAVVNAFAETPGIPLSIAAVCAALEEEVNVRLEINPVAGSVMANVNDSVGYRPPAKGKTTCSPAIRVSPTSPEKIKLSLPGTKICSRIGGFKWTGLAGSVLSKTSYVVAEVKRITIGGDSCPGVAKAGKRSPLAS